MGLQVLIIEDDEVVIYLNRMLIEKSGLLSEPLCFFDGKKALNYLYRNQKMTEKYLVFLDINMPIFNGWDFLDEVKKLNYNYNIYVVLVTSSFDELDRERAKDYPQILDFITKPLKIEHCEVIKNLLETADLIKAGY
ncbi:MAG: response regulator [Bacteroidota bacterium]|nr:response regulator [Bacteroidota bacterium]